LRRGAELKPAVAVEAKARAVYVLIVDEVGSCVAGECVRACVRGCGFQRKDKSSRFGPKINH
jgi:hypothetical protein